jgi:hypothetical protein
MTREEVFKEVKKIIDQFSSLTEKEKIVVFNVLKSELPEGDNFYCYPSAECDIVFEMGSAKYYITYSIGILEIYEPSSDYVLIRIGINYLITA